MNKNILVSLVVALLIGVFVGYTLAPRSIKEVITGAVSAVGTTNNTAKKATIVWSPSTASATTTSILNGDSNDRVIDTVQFACTGVGTSYTAYTGGGLASNGVQITAATSSTANPASIASTNYVLDTSNTLATTTGFAYLSTSTPGTTSATPTNRVWGAGTYLTFASNATNTATCTIGASYLTE